MLFSVYSNMGMVKEEAVLFSTFVYILGQRHVHMNENHTDEMVAELPPMLRRQPMASNAHQQRVSIVETMQLQTLAHCSQHMPVFCEQQGPLDY